MQKKKKVFLFELLLRSKTINTLGKIMKRRHSLAMSVSVYVYLCHFLCSVWRDWCIHWNSWSSLTYFLAEKSKERFAQRGVCMCVCCWSNDIDV